ncbi:MAG: hypothetical protein ACK4JE_03845 [Endomicrobiia bacterium]
MKIIPVETKNDLMNFIKFPWKVYKNDKYWVPPLISEMKTILDENKNPFWKHSEKQFFLAVNNNGFEILGRIAGVIDRNFIRFQNEKTGFFSFFECVNNYEVAENLFLSVEEWLIKKGMKKMLGPTAPSTNDEMGFLLEGFDSSPILMMPYNPKYYLDFAEKYGFKKAKDLYAYFIDRNSLPKERLERIVKAVYERIPDLVVRPVDLKKYEMEIQFIREIYNNAWEKNWGFVPWTEEEFFAQCERLKSLIVPELVLLSFIKDKPVGMLIAVPDYNFVLKKLNGKLGPLEIIKFLFLRRKIRCVRVMVMGVVKEYRNRGIEAVMYKKIIENGIKLGYSTAEFSWILEDNIMMCRAAEMLGGKIYKKYRVYEKEL